MDPIGQESTSLNTNLPELSSGSLESAVKQMESAPSEDNLEIANVSDQISKKQLNKNMIIMKVLPGGSIVYERTESGEIVASIVRNNNNNNSNNGVEDVGINSNDSAELENYIKQSAKKALQQQQQAMNNKKKKIQQQQQLLLKASDDQMKKKRKKRIPNSVEGPSRPGLTCPINDRNVENVLDRTLLVTESLQQVLNNFKEDLKRVGGSSTVESKPVGIKKRIEIADKLTNAYVDYQQAIDDIGELGRGYLVADDEDEVDEEDDGDEDEVDEEGVDDDDLDDDDDDVAAVRASFNYGGGGRIQIEDDVIDEDEEEIRNFIRKNCLKNSKKVNSGKKKVQNLKRVAGTNDEDDEEEEVDELENYARGRVGGVKIEGGQPQVSKGRRKRQRGPDDEDEDFDEVALKKQIYQTKKSKKPPQLQQQPQKSKERPDTYSNKKQKKAINNNNNSSMQNLNNNSINNSSSSSTNKFHDSTPKASTSSKAAVTSSSASTTTKSSPSSSHHLNDYYASKKSWTEVDTDGFGQEKSKDTKFWYDSVNVKHEDTTNVSDDLWMSCEPGSDDEVLYNVGFPKISQKRK